MAPRKGQAGTLTATAPRIGPETRKARAGSLCPPPTSLTHATSQAVGPHAEREDDTWEVARMTFWECLTERSKHTAVDVMSAVRGRRDHGGLDAIRTTRTKTGK